MILQLYYLEFTQEKWKHAHTKTYIQMFIVEVPESKPWHNPSVRQPVNESMKCGITMQWHTMLLQ